MSTKARDNLEDTEGILTDTSNDAVIEQRVVQKLDRNFLSLLWFLCEKAPLADLLPRSTQLTVFPVLLAFLDRSNIG